MGECKYYFGDLVYIDFGDKNKIVGTVKSHRIIKNRLILYKIENAQFYAPSNMIHKLTEKQEEEYHEFVNKMATENNKGIHYNYDEYIEQMQKAITWD